MTTWRLFKRDYDAEGPPMIGDDWREVGTHESDASYWLGPDAPQIIGERFGAGDYLLFGEDNRANSLRIAARTVYYEVDEEEPETVEAVSLKAVHPSADEVMRRDG